ncbi:hypothetical protein [Egbenema bharatensis]|uniref:hypothetical protein n=1 Tax=Egbenema bharatensis TaxID=3463334 RepID=UPI003A8AE598
MGSVRGAWAKPVGVRSRGALRCAHAGNEGKDLRASIEAKGSITVAQASYLPENRSTVASNRPLHQPVAQTAFRLSAQAEVLPAREPIADD